MLTETTSLLQTFLLGFHRTWKFLHGCAHERPMGHVHKYGSSVNIGRDADFL
jgi:hypothetical protein